MLMWDRIRNVLLPRLLFVATLMCAAALVAMVAAGPLLIQLWTHPVLDLFANDITVRRTALASAAALIVTAFVFFRPAAASPKQASPKQPKPGSMAGA
jgi:hypothetical protein